MPHSVFGFAVLACNRCASTEGLFLAADFFSLDSHVCLTYVCSMKRISMFLSDPQIAALKRLSKRVGIKVSELIRRFIDEGLKRV